MEKMQNKILEDSNISSSNIQPGGAKFKADKLPEDLEQQSIQI